jgi:acid phosphatase type 7
MRHRGSVLGSGFGRRLLLALCLVVPFTLRAGGSLQFDGGNDYVTFGQAPGLGLPAFTIETWFKRTGTGLTTSTGSGGLAAIPLVAKGRSEDDGKNVDMNWFLGVRAADNVLAADFEEGASGATPGLNHPVAGTTPIQNNVWHHAAATYDGTRWQLFLDGKLEATLSVGQPPRSDSIQHAALGAALNSSGTPDGYFAGLLDEVRIWNYARSASQIVSSTNLQITAAPGLVGRWSLDEGTGTVAHDSSGSGINGTLLNGPTWAAGFPFVFAPTVAITAPANNAVFDGPLSLLLQASASDPDGSVTGVAFYSGSALLGQVASAPYQFSWADVPLGYYTLTAVATDNSGLASTSAPVVITVQNPVVQITSPLPNARFVIPTDVTITASAATDVTLVEFYEDGVKIGEALSPPFTCIWHAASVGSHALTAAATAGAAVNTSAPVTITVAPNMAPTVTLSAPTDNTSFYLPASITLTATADDLDGTVSKVEFFAGAAKLGEVTAAPYSFTWVSPPPGSYRLTAVATDDYGASGTSSPVNIIVASALVTRSPYLQSATTSGITIRWRTSPATDSRVRYGTDPADLSGSAADAGVTTEHVVTITGLGPDSKYYYTVESSAGPLMADSTLWFRTLPLAGTDKPTRVWVLSDEGYGGAAAASVRNAYTNYTGARGTEVVLTLGDNEQHNGTDAQYQTYFFDVWSGQLRNLTFWTSLGNHEVLTASTPGPYPYFDIFSPPTDGRSGGQPSGTKSYYSFDFGLVHFVCLDSVNSSRAINGAMANWLRQDLGATTQPWRIAYWHHPPYSFGTHNSDSDANMQEMRQNIVPILEAAGVDLVLNGHTHVYERSYLINGHYASSSTFVPSMKLDGGDGRTNGTGPYLKPAGQTAGAVYVVMAVSSQAQDLMATDYPAMATNYRSYKTLGCALFDVSGPRLDFKFLGTNGAVLDYFTLLKGDSQPAPPAVPSAFAATVVASDKIRLSWSNNATNEMCYRLERSLDGVSFAEIASVGANLTVFTNTGLAASTPFFYRLRSWNNAGCSDYTPVASASTPGPPRLVAQPQPATVVVGSPAAFSILAGGTAPLSYQWRKDSMNLADAGHVLGALTSTLTLTGLQTADAGSYDVVVANVSGSVTSQTALLTVNRIDQTITFSDPLSKTYSDLPFDLTATASSGLPVSYTSDNLGVATVSGNTVTVVGAGTANITATQAGDETYHSAAPVTRFLTVAPAAATVTLGNLSHTYDGTPKSVAVTTAPPGLPVSVTYDGFATLPMAVGNYAVVATVANPNYTGAASGTLVISPAINHAPSFAKGPDLTSQQSSGPQEYPAWATSISPGPTYETGQVLNFVVSNDKNYLFSVPPAIDPGSGVLTYAPAPNLRGTATVTAQLHDNGGTDNGGQNTSAVQTFQITIGSPTDVDGNGLPDDWEEAYGLNLHGRVDPDQDADGDGLSNRGEFLAGTDPTNAADFLGITAIEALPEGELLSFRTVPGKLYRVERDDNFPTGPWTQVGTDVSGAGQVWQILDPDAAPLRKGVYRVRLVQ